MQFAFNQHFEATAMALYYAKLLASTMQCP